MPGINPKTGKPGPEPMMPRSGDKAQARQRINVEVRTGYRPNPNSLPCHDCGHTGNDRRHEYDHHNGYEAEHHYDVIPLCTLCHYKRHHEKVTHCCRGHEFTGDNVIVKTNGTRACRMCRRLYDSKKRVRPEGYWRAFNQRRKLRKKGGVTHGDE